MDNYEFKFRDSIPTYAGQTLDDVLGACEALGYTIHFADMRTTLHTTRHKMHGVYVIVLTKDESFHLMSGTYNYLCALEGEASISLQVKHSPALQSDERWSLWDNPMRDRREEAWNKMWSSTRTFTSERDVKEYCITHMKNWEDVGNTLYWARYGG